MGVKNYEFRGKELSVLRVERKRAAVVGVIREFEGLSEKDLEEACVFTIKSTALSLTQGSSKSTECTIVTVAVIEDQMSSRFVLQRFHIISSLWISGL